MNFISKTTGIAAAAVVVLGALAALMPLAMTSYSINGHASCNGVTVLNAEVCLVTSNAMARLQAMGDQRKKARTQVVDAAYRRLESEFLAKAQEELIKYKALAKHFEEMKGNALAKPPEQAEIDEVKSRIARYEANAAYCREQQQTMPSGKALYSKGAQFWEDKAKELKEKGRVAFDEMDWNYEFEEKKSGIGEEPMQLVSKVRRLNPESVKDVDIVTAPLEGEGKVKVSAPKTLGPFDAASFIDTNAVMAAAANVCSQLRERQTGNVMSDDEIVMENQLERVMTDETGNFIMKSQALVPGSYGIYLDHNMLTASGDVLPVRWLLPVSIKSRPLSWNKVTEVELSEKNLCDSSSAGSEPPSREKIFSEFMNSLSEKAVKIK